MFHPFRKLKPIIPKNINLKSQTKPLVKPTTQLLPYNDFIKIFPWKNTQKITRSND